MNLYRKLCFGSFQGHGAVTYKQVIISQRFIIGRLTIKNKLIVFVRRDSLQLNLEYVIQMLGMLGVRFEWQLSISCQGRRYKMLSEIRSV